MAEFARESAGPLTIVMPPMRMGLLSQRTQSARDHHHRMNKLSTDLRVQAQAVAPLLFATVITFTPTICCAQDEALKRGLGLSVFLPRAEMQRVHDRYVLVEDDWLGEAVVAEALMKSPGGYLVVMPHGRLQYFSNREAKETDRPFVPADKDALGKYLVENYFKGFKIRKSRYFLYIYDASDNFAEGTQSILESLVPGAAKFFQSLDFEVHAPKVPLVVIMFRNEADYRKFFEPPTGFQAFYNGSANIIAMYEKKNGGSERRDNAKRRAVSTIAHEGVHQLIANIGVQERISRWPLWITEGLADYLAPGSVASGNRWDGPGKVVEGRIGRLLKHIETNNGRRRDGSFLRKTVTRTRLDGLGYSASWGLTHFLMTKHRQAMIGYLHELSKTLPADGPRTDSGKPAPQNLDAFTRHFGRDLAKLEDAWFNHVKLIAKQAEAQNVYVVSMMVVRSGRGVRKSVGVSSSIEAAREWQKDQLANLKSAQRRLTSIQTRRIKGRAEAEKFAQKWVNKRG